MIDDLIELLIALEGADVAQNNGFFAIVGKLIFTGEMVSRKRP